MPFLFREGLIFMPGDLALYKLDEQHEGEPVTVNKLISGKDNVLQAYQVTLDKDGRTMMCALDELRLHPEKQGQSS